MKTLNATSWIIRSEPRSRVSLRLFCLPYAGGSASIYHSWQDELPEDVEVCAIQLPGREGRFLEPHYTRLVELIETLGSVIHPYLTVPFAFFGHSMGALISFELARYVRKYYDVVPTHLFVSAYRAPHIPRRSQPIHHLPEAEFTQELRNLHGTPEAILQDSEFMQLLLPVLRTDFAVCESYSYSEAPPLECPITAFGGTLDEGVNQDELTAWRDQTQQAFTLHMLLGNHFFLHSLRKPILQVILQEFVWH